MTNWHVYLLSAIFIIAGTFHFIRPKAFMRIMPLYLPYHRALVYLSGLMEIVAGIGVLFVSTNSGDEVLIRIKNVSQYDYTDILVDTNGGGNRYGDLSSLQSSGYATFDFAYRYAFVELQINGETFTIQPIDYVGETKLAPGKYTYEIGANDSTEQYGRLSITLVND